MTVLKIAADLERIGDLAKNIAKRALASTENPPPALMNGLSTWPNWRSAAQGCPRRVRRARRREGRGRSGTATSSIDALYNSLFRELLTYMMEDPRNIGLCTHLLFGAKNIERIGDHTTNIAENIHFLVTGRALADERPKGDDTSMLAPGLPPASGA